MVIEFERVADSVMQSTIVQKMSANQKLRDPMSALRMLLRVGSRRALMSMSSRQRAVLSS